MRSGAMIMMAGAVLAGCAAGVPVERQVVVPGERFLAVQGEAAFFVRTFLVPEDGERREVVGATCTVASSLYSAELVTPSRLVVPNFGPQSPELDVTCTAGAWSGGGKARIVTRWNEPPGYWGSPAGAWGPGWGPGWGWGGAGWGWGGPAYASSDYPNLNVTLR
jgi:hypothetical protein